MLGGQPNTVVSRILRRFAADAKSLIVSAVQSTLGHASLYTLTPDYSRRKPKSKDFVRFAGKDPDQPLILSGQMYYSVDVVMSGDNLVLQLTPNATQKRGFDYGAFWEQQTQFLEKGLAIVEDQLAQLLLNIIVSEMGL